MLPNVVEIKGLDVYRDGGSLSASFRENEDSEYSLFFGINLIANSDRNLESKGYKSPVLELRIRDDYISPVTKIRHPRWKKSESKELSWQQALDLLNKMSKHVADFESDYLWVFSKMLEISGNNGFENKNS